MLDIPAMLALAAVIIGMLPVAADMLPAGRVPFIEPVEADRVRGTVGMSAAGASTGPDRMPEERRGRVSRGVTA